jgi:hypothetical protein
MASDSAATAADITGPILADTASTWTLPPVLPHALPVIVELAPPALLDLALPASFGGGLPTAEEASNRITVAMVRAPSAGYAGMVSVLVPQDVFLSGMAFSFPLPDALLDAVGAHDVRVTLKNGGALPSWLRYVPINKTFVANGTPADGLPIEVLMHIGEQSWIVTITKPEKR